jgi:hypothetical protein
MRKRSQFAPCWLSKGPAPGKVHYHLLQEQFRKDLMTVAALPYCGKVKYHVPDSLAIITTNLANAPDLVQTAEWFGSGGLSFRLTLASERFVKLVQERKWKGLLFRSVENNGVSELREKRA